MTSVAGLVHNDGGDDVVAVHDHSVDVDHQDRQICQAALIESSMLRGGGRSSLRAASLFAQKDAHLLSTYGLLIAMDLTVRMEFAHRACWSGSRKVNDLCR